MASLPKDPQNEILNEPLDLSWAACRMKDSSDRYLSELMIFSKVASFSTHTKEENTTKPIDLSLKTPSEIITTHPPSNSHPGTSSDADLELYSLETKSAAANVRAKSYIQRRNNKNEKFTCPYCEKESDSNLALKRHIRTHTGERPFACGLCDRAFSQSSNLNVHRRTHTKTKPYECKGCKKPFSSSCNLSRHMRTHTGEKPFVCDLCDKTFSQTSHLNVHKRSHTGDKPYKCKQCKKTFSTSSNLSVHYRIHTGEKRHKCEKCGKSFNEKKSLKKHKCRHSEIVVFG